MEFEVTLWSNTRKDVRASIKGIRINKGFKKYLPKSHSMITIWLDDKMKHFLLSNCFNKGCFEVRGKDFYFWAEKHNLDIGDKVILEIIEPLKEYRLKKSIKE